MRTVIDARPALDPRRTGVGRYASEMVRHLPAADPENRYVAWYLDVRGLLRGRRFFDPAPNLAERPSRLPSRMYTPVSWRIGVPRVEWLAGPFDLLLATNFLPPSTGHLDRVILVVHDLAFERFPETAPHVDATWRRRFRDATGIAAGVIVPSAAVRDDLLTGYAVDDVKVHVVPHGTDAHAFRPASGGAVDEVRRRLGIRGPYLLFVGGIEPRKNLVTIVRAFARLETKAMLVIAGGPVRWFPQASAQLDASIMTFPPQVRERIVRTGYVGEADRQALLSGATMLVYPSLAEGFGFPVLEAFAANVPVLTSTVSSLPEVAGEAALLVDPHDQTAVADGMRQLLEDEDLRNVLRAAGTARVAGFTWERCARETVHVLHRASGTPG